MSVLTVNLDALLRDYEAGYVPLPKTRGQIDTEVDSLVGRLMGRMGPDDMEEFMEAMNGGVSSPDPDREAPVRVNNLHEFVSWYVTPLVRLRLRAVLERRRTHSTSDPGADIGINDVLPPDDASLDFPAAAREYRPADPPFHDDDPHLRVTRPGEPAPRMPHRYDGKKVVKAVLAIVAANLMALGMLGALMPAPQNLQQQKKKADPPAKKDIMDRGMKKTTLP